MRRGEKAPRGGAPFARGRPEPRGKRRERPAPLERAEGERLVAEVTSALEAAGFAVIAARAFPDRRIRAMIDGPSALPVTVGDCERASRAMEAAIGALGLDPGTFDLEVESPGADRPLTRESDFERFRGSQVTVTLREAREGRRNFTGKLIGFAAGGVTVHVLDQEEPETFPAGAVKEVRLHPELKAQVSEPSGRSRRRRR